MSYQFDPTRKGLQYESLKMPGMVHPVRYLRDDPAHIWIDLHSFLKALGMSWDRKWRMYFVALMADLGIAECYDYQLRETLLLPDSRVMQVLSMVYQHVTHHPVSARRVRSTLLVWPTEWPKVANPGRETKKRPASRKVTAHALRKLHQALLDKVPKDRISYSLKIDIRTIQKILAGTYPFADTETTKVWAELFGT